MITRTLGQQLCFTRFLIEKDALSLAMTRIGNGFSPPSVLSEAKEHLKMIQNLIHQMEKMAPLPKDTIIAEDYKHLMQKSCCGRGD